MELLRNEDVVINLALFKRTYFCHLFDPNSKKIFHYNVYRFIGVVFFATAIAIVIYTGIGFYEGTKENLNIADTHTLQIVFSYFFVFINLIKIIIFLYKADAIWNLFGQTRIDVLKSALCRKHIGTLIENRKNIIVITNLFFGFGISMVSLWIALPLLFNKLVITTINANQRYLNPIDFEYPVTTAVFNQYYYIFYAAESFILFLWYFSLLIDTFIWSICWMLNSQYEVVTMAFANVGHEKTTEDKINSTSGKWYLKYFETIV